MSDTSVTAPEPEDNSGRDAEKAFYDQLAGEPSLPNPDPAVVQAQVDERNQRLETPYPMQMHLKPATALLMRQRAKHLLTQTYDAYTRELLERVYFFSDQCCRFFVAQSILNFEDVL